MIYINEWFPNPVGNDAAGEFIELYNNGPAPVSLANYQLSDGAKKRFSLSGYTISVGGYLVLNHAQTKLTLKNTDGGLWLYGPGGRIIDQASFTGAAPEGKSYSRVDYSNAPIAHFTFLYPTPGSQNKTIDLSVSERNYPIGVSLAQQLSGISFLVLTFGVGLSLLTIFIYVTHTNRNIFNFFFGRNEKVGP